jgi:hypothetical protein
MVNRSTDLSHRGQRPPGWGASAARACGGGRGQQSEPNPPIRNLALQQPRDFELGVAGVRQGHVPWSEACSVSQADVRSCERPPRMTQPLTAIVELGCQWARHRGPGSMPLPFTGGVAVSNRDTYGVLMWAKSQDIH